MATKTKKSTVTEELGYGQPNCKACKLQGQEVEVVEIRDIFNPARLLSGSRCFYS
ncbi:hypothetical protein ACFLVF_02530 [Chloroflexota bacterium]